MTRRLPWPAAGRLSTPGHLFSQRIFDPADGILDLARDLVRLAVGLELGISPRLADRLLDRTLDVPCRAGDTILIHESVSFNEVCLGPVFRAVVGGESACDLGALGQRNFPAQLFVTPPRRVPSSKQ